MKNDFYSAPPHYAELRMELHQLAARHPRARVFSIGKTLLGREILAVSMGRVQNATLMVGGVHGGEWITTLLLTRFAGDIIEGLCSGEMLGGVNVSAALENRSLVILPCLNPDGVEISLDGPSAAGVLEPLVTKLWRPDQLWQANARGVDLNHNFNAGWKTLRELERADGIDGPCASRYGGSHPHSEPETRAAAGFCLGASIRQVYAFHSQGEEIYCRYGPRTPAHAQLMAQVLASACGYKVCNPTGTASHGGLKDWFIQQTGRPGFTIEVGRGQNPLPVQEMEPIYARLIEMLLLAVIL